MSEPRDTGDLAAVPVDQRRDYDDPFDNAEYGLGDTGAEPVDNIDEGTVIYLTAPNEEDTP